MLKFYWFFGLLATFVALFSSVHSQAVSISSASKVKNTTSISSKINSSNATSNTQLEPYISEIWYSSPTFEDKCGYKTFKCTPDIWLEIYNPNDFQLDLNGYSLDYSIYYCTVKTSVCKPSIPNLSIPAKGTAVIANKFGSLNHILDRVGVNASASVSLFTSANGVVDYQKTMIGINLVNSSGNTVDSLAYSIPKNAQATEFRSLERCKVNGKFDIKPSQNLLSTIENYSIYATPNQNNCSDSVAQSSSNTVPVIPNNPPTSISELIQPQVQTISNLTEIQVQPTVIESLKTSIAPQITPTLAPDSIPALEKSLAQALQTNTQTNLETVTLKQTQPQTQSPLKVEFLEKMEKAQTISQLAYKPFVETISITNQAKYNPESNFNTKNTSRLQSNFKQQSLQQVSPSKSTSIWHNSNFATKVSYISNAQEATAELDNFNWRVSLVYLNLLVLAFFVYKVYKDNLGGASKLFQKLNHQNNLS
jgi:hypothetical protein